MRNYFFALCCITHVAYGMEKPSEFPSLKKLCLQTLAYQLAEEYSDKSTAKEKEHLYAIFDNILYLNQLEQLEKVALSAIKRNAYYPVITSENTPIALFSYWDDQYIGSLDDSDYRIRFADECSLSRHENEPVLSPDGTKLIGWSAKPYAEETLCCIDIPSKVFKSCLPHSKYRMKEHLHYAFTPNGNIVFRDNKSLYICKPDDLMTNGEKALISFYTRDDAQEYPANNNNVLHAFTDSLIVCPGPDEKSFELFQKSDDSWKLSKTVPTSQKIIKAAYALHKPYAVTIEAIEGNALNCIHLYDFATNITGSITIKSFCSYPFAATFSPDGKYLTCGTNKGRGEIDIVDCSDIEKPFIYTTISVVSGWPITRINWHSTGMYVMDGLSRRYDIPNPFFISLITAYKESKKPKNPESNNNNAQ